jgi:hypothetical protein
MPSYFPENNTPLPTDTVERSLQKAVSLISSAVEDGDGPTPSDSNETLAQKLVKSLGSVAYPVGTSGVEEAPEDGTPYARKDADWTPTVGLEEDGSIAAIVQVRQGTAAELGEIVLNDGEIAIELEGGVPKQLKVGDGTTAGGVVPSINDWTIVQGTSDDDQQVSNSITRVDIDFFENAVTFEVGAFYEIAGKMQFVIDAGGGFRISANDLASSMLAAISGDWLNEFITLGQYQTDSSDTGIISFQGFVKIAPSTTFNVSFAQKTATEEGFVQFNGSESYIAYRKIA